MQKYAIFFFQAEDGIRDLTVTGVQTCALPISQPTSASCGPSPLSPFAPPAGQRATSPADRNCADGSVLTRNTLRKDNAFFSWDVRLSRPINTGRQGQAELIIEVFNVTNTDNFKDPAYGGLLFNFDGTIRSGLGDPRQLQAGLRWVF